MNRGYEKDEDLVVLCDECHKKFHDIQLHSVGSINKEKKDSNKNKTVKDVEYITEYIPEKTPVQMPFVMFDKNLITTSEFIKDKNKLPLIIACLKLNSSLNGKVGVSINMLINSIGYKPNSRKGQINSKVRNALIKLKSEEHIIVDKNIDLATIRPSECFIVKLNYDNENNVFTPKGSYVILTEREFDTITQGNSNSDRLSLLNVFLNIKSCINFGGMQIPICYPSHRFLSMRCDLSSIGTINNLIKELNSLKILYTYNPGRYLDYNGKVKYANNFYALEDNVLIPEECDKKIKAYYSMQGILIDRFIKG